MSGPHFENREENTCSHLSVYDDEKEGHSVCLNCGLVLQQLFTFSHFNEEKEYSFEEKFLQDVCKENNLAGNIPQKAYELWTLHFPEMRKSHFFYYASLAFCLYEALLYADLTHSLTEISRMTGVTPKKIKKLESQMKYNNNYFQKPIHFIERYGKILYIPFFHIKIMTNIALHLIDFHYIKPQCVSAMIIYLYCQENDLDYSLKDICSVCQVSISHVKQLCDDFIKKYQCPISNFNI